MKNDPLVSIIIPVYNEQESIARCLETLNEQTYKNIEIILVDDGSTDKTIEIASHLCKSIYNQNHQGPGVARNYGVSKSKGEIIVFVDADMTFSPSFIEKLIKPILDGNTIGTFSKDEFVSNSKEPLSVCWNINRNLPKDRMIPESFKNTSPVYRAILKEKFLSVNGFDTDGQYIDDWSLSKKLKKEAIAAPDAIYYHSNPSTYGQVWSQARWIGKNDFISGTLIRRLISLIKYSFPLSVLIGVYKATVYGNFHFLLFKPVYDLAITLSVLESFANKSKFK